MSAKTDVLHVELRDQTGTAAAVRLRRTGKVPAVLYGHGQPSQHLAIDKAEVKLLLRHHGKAVTLDGALKETALVSDVQFDPLGIHVLHLDLIRVNLEEAVTVMVPVQMTGDAAGSRSGGVLLENVHEVEIECSAGSIPEFLTLDVTDLQVGANKFAREIKLPEGVKLLTSPETVIAHIERPRGEKDPAVDLAAPEVVAKGGEKKAE